MPASHTDQLKQLDELLSTSNQSRPLGAGISLDAGLPLMGTLTQRVLTIAKEKKPKSEKILAETQSLLPKGSTIEQILSHFADFLAIAERSKTNAVTIGITTVTCDELRKLLQKSLSWIAETIRWGYVAAKGQN